MDIKTKKIIQVVSAIIIFIIGIQIGRAWTKIPVLKSGKEVVVSLKNTKITADALYNEMKGRFAKDTISYLIDEAILNHKYQVDENLDKEIKGQITLIKEQTGDNFLAAIKNEWGLNNEDELYDFIAISFKRNMAIEDYVKTLIKEHEIEDYYDEQIKGDIKVSHILIKPEVEEEMSVDEKEEAEKEALAQAKKLIKKLNDGADFAALAKEYSADEGNAADGGNLDWFNVGKMTPAFEDAAYNLKKGKYSKEPVKTEFGYHVILKTDEKEKPKLKTVKDDIIDELINEKIEIDPKLTFKALEKLRKTYKLKIHDSKLDKQYYDYQESLKQQQAQ